jgi:hypothetical protein
VELAGGGEKALIYEDCMRGGMLKGSGVRENAAVIVTLNTAKVWR